MSESPKETACPENDFEPFDWDIYGAIVRMTRRKRGYKNFQQFSDAIYRRTRKPIAPNVLKRIEQGRQEPTASQFMAINLSLFKEFAPTQNDKSDLAKCLSDEWRFCIDFADNKNGGTPGEWRLENLEDAIKANGDAERLEIRDFELHDDLDVFIPDVSAADGIINELIDKGELFRHDCVKALGVADMRILFNDVDENYECGDMNVATMFNGEERHQPNTDQPNPAE